MATTVNTVHNAAALTNTQTATNDTAIHAKH